MKSALKDMRAAHILFYAEAGGYNRIAKKPVRRNLYYPFSGFGGQGQQKKVWHAGSFGQRTERP